MYTAAIVGAGFIAREKHMPAWRRLRQRVRIVAICDQDHTRAQSLGRACGIQAVYQDVQRMLDVEQPDFVDVCTPPASHAKVAVAALNVGAHVLIEKPMATTVAECERIREAEENSKGRVGVAHSELYYPPVIEARLRVKRGDIGDFMGMRIFRSTPIGAMTSVSGHWANRLPGGVIGETGPHVVYLSLAFIDPILQVTVQAKKLLPQFPESLFEDYRLDLSGGKATSSAVLTYTNRHSAAHVDLWGTEGMLRLELQSRVLVNYDRCRQDVTAIGMSACLEATQTIASVLTTGAKYLAGQFRNPHDELIKDFFERCVRGIPLSVSSTDGLKTVQIMHEICRQL